MVNKDRFEAPDLLLPSMQKIVPENSTTINKGSEILTNEDDYQEDQDEMDYGEEYDDTRTFTVKDFKE